MRYLEVQRCLLGLLLLGLTGAATGSAAQDRPGPPRARAPAAVMSFRGADWLERPQRDDEERPEEVLAIMGLRDGHVVADIGAGSGYFSRRIARLVGPTGTVLAVDVQQEMLDLLRENMAEEGLTGVVPVLGTADDPNLPEGEVDWILLVDVYHEFANPTAMLARMRQALKPTGRIALVEYRVEDGSGDHIRASHRMSVLQVLSEWGAGGFELVELHESLPSQHLFILRPSSASGAGSSGGVAQYDLLEAVGEGRVAVSATGGGAEAVGLTIRRTRPEDMVITLPVGTYFGAPGEPGDMIARRDGMALLLEDGDQAWSVPARRVELAAPAPGQSDRLEIRSADDNPQLRDLTWFFQGLDLFAAIAPTVEQIAIWIAAEDRGWEDLSRHAAANSIHAANAVALGAAHVNALGIDIRQKRIWAERASFVPALTDDGLKRIFAELEGN